MSSPTSQARTIAIIAYLTMVGSLISITMNLEPQYEFSRFHTRQAFGLHLGFLGFAIFLNQWFNPYAWIALYLSYLVLWVYGFVGALKGRKTLVPLVGSYFQQWFIFIR